MILVTGGTGLIGSHLLFQLVQDGKSVKATYRTQKSLEKVSKVFDYYTDHPESLLDKITWVQADITDVGTLEKAFKDVTHVYHCAALISFDPRQLDQLLQANSEATAHVVNLCIANRVKKLCYVSSIAAIGPSAKGKMATEENEWNDTNVSVYGLTKHDAELEVWRGEKKRLWVVGGEVGGGLWAGFLGYGGG
ncbi:MAG: NAD-dependent epimerase/dehydratase family protein, partial [Allomuricauda sp.]